MKLHLILSPVTLDSMVHKFDIFEESKKLVYMEVMEVEFKNHSVAYDLILAIRDKINQLGRHKVVALFMPEISGAGWYDEDVQTIDNMLEINNIDIDDDVFGSVCDIIIDFLNLLRSL